MINQEDAELYSSLYINNVSFENAFKWGGNLRSKAMQSGHGVLVKWETCPGVARLGDTYKNQAEAALGAKGNEWSEVGHHNHV